MKLENVMLDRISFIAEIADQQLHKECFINNNSSFMPSGHNGPYYDVETPVRNTAHWLVIYSCLWKYTKQERYHKVAKRLLSYLLDCEFISSNYVYIQRQKHGKDWCNGVIGQAWVIEAFAVAGECLDNTNISSFQQKVVNSFEFDRNTKAWSRIDPYTGKKRIDYTLNHQLWYASSLSMLDDSKHDQDIIRFLTALKDNGFRVRSDGRVCHLMYSTSLKGLLLRGVYFLNWFRRREALNIKEVGYHLYNMYPLARLCFKFPDHELFHGESYKLAEEYSFSDKFKDLLQSNKYAYPYNAPGFEVDILCRLLGNNEADYFWDKQIESTYLYGAKAFGKNSPDGLILNARIYEYLLGMYCQQKAVR